MKKLINIRKHKCLLLTLTLGLCLLFIVGCGNNQNQATIADKVIKSTNIYTVANDQPISGAIAVTGNQITAVGTAEEIAPYIGKDTEVFEMGDKLVLPGLMEGHTHVEGPAIGFGGINLLNVESPEECAKLIKEYADANPGDGWIFGFGWYAANWPDGTLPDKKYLDAVCPDRPVFLLDFDYHNGWFNSKGLETININKDTPEPESGAIIRDENGEPTGYVQDGPMWDAYDIMYGMVEDNIDKYMQDTFQLYASLGITGINDMGSWTPDDSWLIDYLDEADKKNTLGTRVFFTYGLFENEVNTILEAQKKYSTSDKLRLTSVKGYLDGVGSVGTAAMLQPYANNPSSSGELVHPEAEYTAKILEADAAGLNIHIHACGDRAVRVGLDAYEKAIEQNKDRSTERRLSLEHCDTIAPDDLPRFAKLGITANITPDFMAPTISWAKNPYIKAYDENVRQELWLIKSLLDSGAKFTYGSDAPCSALNPMIQIYRATARVTNDGNPKGGYMPEQIIPVKESIKAYTINSAYNAGMEDKLGTLEAGKLADIIVLDHDILTVPAEQIKDTKVVLTLMDGIVKYQVK